MFQGLGHLFLLIYPDHRAKSHYLTAFYLVTGQIFIHFTGSHSFLHHRRVIHNYLKVTGGSSFLQETLIFAHLIAQGVIDCVIFIRLLEEEVFSRRIIWILVHLTDNSFKNHTIHLEDPPTLSDHRYFTRDYS